jgi:hypothetical protein
LGIEKWTTSGRVVFVVDDGGGNAALAVGDGSAWKKVTLGSF